MPQRKYTPSYLLLLGKSLKWHAILLSKDIVGDINIKFNKDSRKLNDTIKILLETRYEIKLQKITLHYLFVVQPQYPFQK